MKKLQLLAITLIAGSSLMAQDFPGYRAGNYTGVNGVFFNPANIADSRYRWDVNLFSLNTSLANNNASFKLKDLSKSFDTDSIKTQLFGEKAGPSNGLLSVNFVGPSVMFNVGKKMSFALTTRARTIANIKDIDGKLASKLVDGDDDIDDDLPYTIASDKNMAVSVNAWTEFGLSMGRIFCDEGKHFFKGGVSLKYLAGAANAHLYINKLHTILDKDIILDDHYLTDGTGTIGVGFGGVRITDEIKAKDLLAFKSTGIGADLGFVYEFRPDFESYKSSDNKWHRDENKYKFRVGVALLDIGKIKYKKDMDRSGAYDLNIDNTEKFYLDGLDNKELDEYNDYLKAHPEYFTPTAANLEKDIKVSLPTTLQLDLDYHFHRGFYMSVAGQLAFSKLDKKPYNSQYYNGVTITPRLEGKRIGIYVPVNYNDLTKLNAGISLRFGPLFIGSGSVLTALMGDSKQADVHIGLHVSGLQKKTKKSK